MDWDHIHQLLDIAAKAQQWPPLKAIHKAAMAELEKIANPPAKAEPVAKDESAPAPEQPYIRRTLDNG